MDATYKFSLAMMLKKYFSLVLLVNYIRAMVTIDRDELDTTHGYTQCSGFERTTGWWSSCTCRPQYSTIMSVEDEEYNCETPKEIYCNYRLEGNEQTLLVTDNNVNAQIIPLEDGAKTNGLEIKKIYTWNYDGYIGNWRDMTLETNDLFEIKDGPLTNLSISNMESKIWAGHVVKVEFTGGKENCLVVKVKGTQHYPFDEAAFRKVFAKTPTTGKPTASVSTKAKATTQGPSEAPTTQGKPKTTPPEPTTERVSSPRFSTPTIASTIASTTSAGGRPAPRTDSQTATKVAVPIVVIIILAVVIGIFYYRRRKAAEKDCSDNGSVSKAKNIYPDISMVNNAYAPEVYKNNMFIEPADTCTNIDTLPPSYSQANLSANAENEHTGQDSHSGPCSAENPVYMCYAESLSDSDKDSNKDEYVNVDVGEEGRTTNDDDAR